MTIGGWIAFVLFAALILCAGIAGACLIENVPGKIISVVVAILLILGLFFGMRWYFQNTASGQRSLTDQKSDLDNGLERTVTIYTADGEIIAQYTGKIDIEGNDGGYVLFDYEGKRYTYYNCFVETFVEEGLAMTRIRLGDKFSRFKTLSRLSANDAGQQRVTDESIRDTLMDLANYAIMTILEMDMEKGAKMLDPNAACMAIERLRSPQ